MAYRAPPTPTGRRNAGQNPGPQQTPAPTGSAATLRMLALECLIPPEVLRLWRGTLGETLFPVQERAVKDLFGGGNMLVVSPSSSGKTLIAEMAAVDAVRHGSRMVYVAPHAVLAAERFRELRRRYGPLGYDVTLSSRLRREHDPIIQSGRFHIAVVVCEKLHRLLVGQPDLLEDVAVVVVDEIEMLGDNDRGPALELVLTALRRSRKAPRLIGLSSSVYVHDLARWLDARIVVDRYRPVELRQGVLVCGEYRYREHVSGADGVEVFDACRSRRTDRQLTCVSHQLAERGEQVVIFVPHTMMAVRLARAIAEATATNKTSATGPRLNQTEESEMQEVLNAVMAKGVGIHHPDLTAEERRTVERAFATGGLKIVVATGTLSATYKLTAKNVVLVARGWSKRGRCQQCMQDLSRTEYERFSGRAGRLPRERLLGRSILVTHSEVEASSLFETYVDGRCDLLQPRLADSKLDDLVLALVAARQAQTGEEVQAFLRSTFTWVVHWGPDGQGNRLVGALEQSIHRLLQGCLVEEASGGRLVPTHLGSVAAGRGLDVRTVLNFAAWARGEHRVPPHGLELLTVIGQSEAGAHVGVRYSRSKEDEATYWYKEMFVGRVQREGLGARAVFDPYMNAGVALDDHRVRVVKKALAMMEWIDETPVRRIEMMFRILAGSIHRIGVAYSYLCRGLSAVAAACGWRPGQRLALNRLSDRLMFGVGGDALDLMRLNAPGFERPLVSVLRKGGLLEPRAIHECGETRLAEILGVPPLAGVLWRRARSALSRAAAADTDVLGATPVVANAWAMETPWPALTGLGATGSGRAADGASPAEPASHHSAMRSPHGPAAQSDDPQPQGKSAGVVPAMLTTDDGPRAPVEASAEVDLVIDVQARRVRLWGREVPAKPPGNLTERLFLVLTYLALKPGKVVSAEDLCSGIPALFPRSRKLIALEPRDLRYRILQALRACAPEALRGRLETLVENLPAAGLRLNANAVVVGLENQRNRRR
jgi:helicase